MYVSTGPKHHQWKGGRRVASNGYVQIRVARDHPQRMKMGYAYEHRIVMEQILHRTLRPDEMVHHINGDKTDNRPENLEVVTAQIHRSKHRGPNCRRRLPDEPNPIIICGCGCGQSLELYDKFGRPRRFVQNHGNALCAVRGERWWHFHQHKFTK